MILCALQVTVDEINSKNKMKDSRILHVFVHLVLPASISKSVQDN